MDEFIEAHQRGVQPQGETPSTEQAQQQPVEQPLQPQLTLEEQVEARKRYEDYLAQRYSISEEESVIDRSGRSHGQSGCLYPRAEPSAGR
jgi:hypothetical protein